MCVQNADCANDRHSLWKELFFFICCPFCALMMSHNLFSAKMFVNSFFCVRQLTQPMSIVWTSVTNTSTIEFISIKWKYMTSASCWACTQYVFQLSIDFKCILIIYFQHLQRDIFNLPGVPYMYLDCDALVTQSGRKRSADDEKKNLAVAAKMKLVRFMRSHTQTFEHSLLLTMISVQSKVDEMFAFACHVQYVLALVYLSFSY